MRAVRSLTLIVSLLALGLSGALGHGEEKCCGEQEAGVSALAVVVAQAAADSARPPAAVVTVEPAAINRTPPVEQPLGLPDLGGEPTTERLRQVRYFADPCVPVGVPTAAQNRAFAEALIAYRVQPGPDVLQRFLDAEPASPWAASVALTLGDAYRRSGHFSRAARCWRLAWDQTHGETIREEVMLLADRAAGELVQFQVWIGNLVEVKQLLAETRGRRRIGPGAERLQSAQMAVAYMENHAETNYICGPLGIETICALKQMPGSCSTLARACKATPRGVDLGTVAALAQRVGLSYQVAKRVGGAAIPLPALVHWKFDHYSVISRQEHGRYLVSDQTFDPYQGRELWITQEALDEEMSGYCLIPTTGTLPAGWLAVSADEQGTIWGKGAPQNYDGDDGGCGGSSAGGGSGGGGGCHGMPIYGMHPSNVALGLVDMPLGYQPVRGPAVEFILRYNSKESHLPATFQFSNVGAKWDHNWLSYVVDDPALIASVQVGSPQTTTTERYPRGGGYERYSLTYTRNSGTNVVTSAVSSPYYRNMNRLDYTGTAYRITTSDQMTYTYGRSDGALAYPRKMLLTQISDRFGNNVTLAYDASNRITGITDALGQVTAFAYGDSDPLKITQVTDPFGRATHLTYGGGLLTGVSDVIGLASSFTYETATDIVQTMTTPYGTTTFSHGTTSPIGTLYFSEWLEALDPAGDKERIEFAPWGYSGLPYNDAPADTPTGVLTEWVNYAVTYFWDKKAMRNFPKDYTQAKAIGWMMKAGHIVTDTVENVKLPLQNRVWYNYPNQTVGGLSTGITINSPSKVARVVDDGTTQLSQTTYNGVGMVTETIDPLGRKMGYTYDASGLNLTEVRMTTGGATELLLTATYTAQNLPLNVTDANGRVTSYLYNAFGQPTSVTLPQRAGQPVEKIQYTYDAQGYLTRITDPLNGTTDFTYDGYGRVRTVKDRDTYTLTYDYDNLDRMTKVTFPDGTYTQTSYGRLDAEWTRDREGRWTRRWFDALRKVVAVRDPAGQITGLSWCRCGALASLADPMGRITQWNYDVQNRLASKVLPDGTATTYAYQPKSGRLASQTDAKGQITVYDYFGDNALKQISYPNAQIATPTVSYTYDSTYGRLATMTDGTGVTTYGYGLVPLAIPVPAITGAGQLSTIDGPLTNDTITLAYDEWSRATGTDIGGSASSVQLDAIGRVLNVTNPLGAFQYTYVGATNRLNDVVAPNGMKTIMAYQALASDFRVSSIRHQTAAAARISEQTYQYSPQGRITQWTQQVDNATATVWGFGSDPIDQLTTARATSGTSTGALIKELAWEYDQLGNRLSERLTTTTSNAVGKSTPNTVNQLMSTSAGGRIQIKGQIDEPGTVTVNNVPVQVNPDKTFTAEVDTQTGANTFTVKATDLKGNLRTDQFRIDTTANGTARTLQYDLNGNCTVDGTTTYEWDGQNRLVTVISGTKRSEFTYDGAGRRVRIVEKISGATVTDRRYVWLGSTVAEMRDSGGSTVLIRYHGMGETEGATKRYYTRDHLGSVREVVDQTGGVLVRYDYDMFGKRTRVSGSDAVYVCTFGYTGHVHHEPSGLELTWFRAYDPASGRWLSRDPIAEAGGLNYYAYVGNRPTYSIDPLGLCDPITLTLGGTIIVLGPEAVSAIGVGLSVVVGGTIGYLFPDIPAGKTMSVSGSGFGTFPGQMYPGSSFYNPSRPLNTQSTLEPFKERFDTPEDAIGPEAFHGIKKVGSGPTTNDDIYDQGFTETEYYECGGSGRKWTVHKNPDVKTGQYTGAHVSSGQKPR